VADAPNFLGVDHISITVTDMDASVRFYVDQLGMPLNADVSVDDATSNDPHFGPLYHAPHPRRRMVMLGPVGGVIIALIAHPGDDLVGVASFKLDDVGLNHFALTVSDLDGLMERMRSFGIEPVASGYFADPDGNLIQFHERGESDKIRAKFVSPTAG
jgi:catechol 2,3-dioxygenase-like lactoylglutathione lyase family enzyme